jgi:glutathione S-transferase
MKPLVTRLARAADASDETVRADFARLPEHLDRIDAWIADGTIGGPEPNAADYQIGTTLRAMMAMEDFAPAIEGRPAAELARRIVPEYPGRLPAVLPLEWRTRPA